MTDLRYQLESRIPTLECEFLCNGISIAQDCERLKRNSHSNVSSDVSLMTFSALYSTIETCHWSDRFLTSNLTQLERYFFIYNGGSGRVS